jgi:outer membrane protein assembly factor BamB
MAARLKSLLALVAACGTAEAAGWRGDGSGQYPSANPVTKWTDRESVLWTAEVGKGHSSPIVVGQRVLIMSEPDLLVCLDAETGRELWRKAHKLADISPEAAMKGARHSSQYGDATPTPVSDGHWVWVFLGTGIAACHDLAGKTRWMNWYDMRQTTNYGRTASPVLVGGRLLVHFGPLACLDAATGKLLWKNDNARATYGTPAAARIGEVDVAVTPKGQVVRVADGKVLATDLGNCMYTSPVVQGRVVYFVDGSMSAVQLPDRAAEQVECKELWSGELAGGFFASPLVHGGRLYTVNKAAKYHVIDAATGKVVLSKKLEFGAAAGADGASVYPSPCLAGKHLFVGNDAGQTLVVEPGDQGVAIGAGSLPGGSGATPAFSGRRVFVRGGTLLHCLAAP